MSYPATSQNGYGGVGNKVIFGHSSYWKSDDGRYKTQFGKIIELDKGEEVWVYKRKINGEYERFRYIVQKSYNTSPSNTNVLDAGIGQNLTLFTCTPIGGISGRWIIEAKYISEIKGDLEKDLFIKDFPFKYKKAVSRIINKIKSYKGDKKKLIILKAYKRLINMETKTKNVTILKIIRYIKLELAIEFFN